MAIPLSYSATFFLALYFGLGAATVSPSADDLATCLTSSGVNNFTEPEESSYSYFLQFSIQNLRYNETWVPKPGFIIMPESYGEVQATVRCCVAYGWQMRIRSGGHSYEGQSSWSDVAFVIVDLLNLDGVEIDVESESAWVQAGTTLGNLYVAIANVTNVHGFPGGTCPTVNTGGLIHGGGYGMLTRKYGLAGDNIDDALLVDPEGNILDREAMGEDVFWALRGGGGGSWGIVVAWKIELVRVTELITVFTLNKFGRDVISRLMYKWQFVGFSTVDDLQLRTTAEVNTTTGLFQAKFYGYYLGRKDSLMQLMNATFPELGLTEADCMELTYIEAVDYFAQEFIGTSLTDRYFTRKAYFKAKSDFVHIPIPVCGYEGFFKLLEQRPGASTLITPFGGAMGRIPWDASPFPHRAGNLMIIHYGYFWSQLQSPENETASIQYVRDVAAYLRPYVTRKPRGAYINYIDLDLGYAYNGTASVAEASAWGFKYFGKNYFRLVKAKTQIDPTNVFRYAQSIPPATAGEGLAVSAM